MTAVDFELLLKEHMGLDSVSVGAATIESAVQTRMQCLEIACAEDYWEKLRSSDRELQELTEAVIVPETWFFRDEDAFAALARLAIERWLPSHPTGPLHMLSGACCSGEEPYSMAMTLLDAGVSRDRLQIDAVDISLRALGRAKRGVYGANSFRGTNLAFRDRYFDPTPNGYRLAGWIRDTVSFHHGNLLSANFRPAMASYDVIFCRNVLIYFDRVTQEQVLERLGHLLAPAGFLFVGPAEAFLATSNGFKSINQSMSFAFRRESAPDGASLPIVAAQTSPPKTLKIASKTAKKTRASVSAQTLAAPSPVAVDLEDARRLADAGQLQKAAELCELYLKTNAPSSPAYYLLGLVRDATGDLATAADCYRKALYLEPDHVEAMLHLALLLEREGDRHNASHFRKRAGLAEKRTKQ